MSDDFNAFLQGGKPEEEPQPEPQVEEPVAETPPEPETPAEPAPAETPAEPAAPANGRMVPLAALEAERTKRQEFERQLEQYRKQQAAPNAPQEQQAPAGPMSPEEAALHIRADMSKSLLEDKIGEEAVKQLEDEFTQAAQADPSLRVMLWQQRNPYQWAQKEMARRKAAADIGDDPAAYRARIRAEIEAEMAGNAVAPQVPTQVTPSIPTMAPSLAKARSAAPRSAPAFTGTPHVNDVFGNRD